MAAKSYTGSCHCGRVRFETTVDLSDEVLDCNCSMCGRRGALMTFPPAEQFKLLAGEGALTDYQWGKKNIHNLFCSSCGVHSFAHGKDEEGATTYMVNVRCLEGVDTTQLPVTHVDGKSR